MKLICITGIDGTGKSTLARGVTAELQQHGTEAKYIYGRTVPLLSRAAMWAGRLLALRGTSPWTNYDLYTASKKQRMHHPLLAAGYTSMILADYLIQIWCKLLPRLFSDRFVICDRYVYDTVISDLAVHLDYPIERTSRAIARLLRVMPRPALAILLDVPPEVAFSRKDDVPHIDYLTERREHYLRVQDVERVIVLDGQASPDDLVRAIIAEIERRGLLDRRTDPA